MQCHRNSRMFNECIFELFAEVPVGTQVVVK